MRNIIISLKAVMMRRILKVKGGKNGDLESI